MDAFSYLHSQQQAIATNSVLDVDSSEETSFLALKFQLGNSFYLAKITEIKEVINVSQAVEVFGTKDFVKGLINLRSEIFPLTDLNLFLYGAATKETRQSRVLVVKQKNELFGLLVNAIYGMQRISQDMLSKISNHSENKSNQFVTAKCNINGENIELIGLLDIIQHQSFKQTRAREYNNG